MTAGPKARTARASPPPGLGTVVGGCRDFYAVTRPKLCEKFVDIQNTENPRGQVWDLGADHDQSDDGQPSWRSIALVVNCACERMQD